MLHLDRIHLCVVTICHEGMKTKYQWLTLGNAVVQDAWLDLRYLHYVGVSERMSLARQTVWESIEAVQVAMASVKNLTDTHDQYKNMYMGPYLPLLTYSTMASSGFLLPTRKTLPY